jgi:hypothetical protein
MIIEHNGIILESNNSFIDFPITPSPGGIVTNGLFMELDASNPLSYPGSGSIWSDLTGNGNNGTLNGVTYLTTDGGLFDFDGINDTITIPNNINLSLSTIIQKTIQVWVKFDVLPTSTNRMIVFGKLSATFSFDGWWGGINSTSNPVIATNGTGISKTSASTSGISLNTWYLMTFISQITATANTTKVYINETEYITTFHGSDGYSESNNLTLGYLTPPLTGLGLISYLNGKIGACYFYTKGLTPIEISTNFNSTKSRYGV